MLPTLPKCKPNSLNIGGGGKGPTDKSAQRYSRYVHLTTNETQSML